MRHPLALLAAGIGTIVLLAAAAVNPRPSAVMEEVEEGVVEEGASHHGTASRDTIIRLTEEDYAEVAERLGVEVAAMKAVVEIEAGKTHQGFSAPGRPLVNFDLTMFRRMAGRRGINLTRYYRSHPQVFNRPRRATQEAVNRRLDAARTIDNDLAVEGTFWGMFQIGGFNWKKCGATSVQDFAERMSRSERDQLELFANFLQNTGLDKALRNKNWAQFARGYNGASYARRGYHTRMASAYARYKRQG